MQKGLPSFKKTLEGGPLQLSKNASAAQDFLGDFHARRPGAAIPITQFPALLHSIAEYGKDVGKEIWDKTTRSLLLAGVLLSIAFGLYHLRRKAHALKDLPEEITLFERFGRRIFVDFTNSYPAFVPLITFGLTLAAFP